MRAHGPSLSTRQATAASRTASTVSYTANALSQYTAVGIVTPSYDGNGNLTGDGTFTYGYDAENRLVSASAPGVAASYAYDAQGRRKSKTVDGATTLFVNDADNREVLEYDGASGAPLRWYAYGLGSNDALNQMNVAAATRATFVPDIQGSIVATLDSGTGALAKSGYLPYGRSASTSGTFRYTGQRIDPETGLQFYRTRMYAPSWGRFMQADPIGYSGGANLYAYVGNDPLNWVDSWGLTPDAPAAAAGGSGGDGGPTGPPGGAAPPPGGGGGDDGDDEDGSRWWRILQARLLGQAVERGVPFSRIVPGGGLSAHEAAGGHLLLKHVGQTESQLMARLAAEPRITGSSSYDRAIAESAISNALGANAGNISNWLSGSSGRLRIDYAGQNPVGISVARDASGAIDVNSIRLILVRNPSMPTGYHIQTGFPTKP